MVKFPFSRLTRPIKVFDLPNGLKVVEHFFPSPASGLSLLVKCGPIFENPQNSGISHFLEHMLFRGTPKYPSSVELGLALDRVGSEANAATFSDMTVVSTKVLPEAMEEALRLFRSMVTEPVFDGIAAERRIILEECLEDLDEEGQLIAVDQLSSQLMFGTHPYSSPILGTPETVKRFTRKQLETHLRNYYTPQNTVLSISGGIGEKDASGLVRSVFSPWKNNGIVRAAPTVPDIPAFEGPHLLTVRSSRSQVQVRVSFRCPAFSDSRHYLVKALVRILDCASGSPLRRVLQDESGLCYSLTVCNDAYEKAGALHVDLFVHPDLALRTLNETLSVFKRLRENPLSPDSVEHAVFQYLKGKRFAATDLWDFSGRVAFSTLFPTAAPFASEFEAMQETTPKDLFGICAKIFRRENLGVTLIGTVSPRLEAQIRKRLETF